MFQTKTTVSVVKKYHTKYLPQRFVYTGFNLYLKDQNILGFSADSGFNQAAYEKIFAASTVVVDARTESSKEHASVGAVMSYQVQQIVHIRV